MSIGEQRERERKREEQWRCQINREHERSANDLIAQIPPERERLVEVRSMGGAVPAGAELSARLSDDGSSVEFLRGETVCGRANPEVIAQLGAPVEATLFQTIEDQNGVLCLRALPLDRRSFRPPIKDDDVH